LGGSVFPYQSYFTRAQTEGHSAKDELDQLFTLNQSPKSPFRERVEIYGQGASRDDAEEEESSDVELRQSLELFDSAKQGEAHGERYDSPNPPNSPSPPLRAPVESSPKLIPRKRSSGERALVLARRRQPPASPESQDPRRRGDTPRPPRRRRSSVEDFVTDETLE
jgi:hypothetical protein